MLQEKCTFSIHPVIRDVDVTDKWVEQTLFACTVGPPIFPMNVTSFIAGIGCRRFRL